MEKAFSHVLSFLPAPLRAELLRVGTSHHRFAQRLSDIRLRAEGLCSLTVGGQNLSLATRLGCEDMRALLTRLCGGAVYAFREPLLHGYLPLSYGVRVGVCGRMTYDGEGEVGVSDVRSLVFRLPHGVCDSEETLYREWRHGVGHGMLIYSPPGGGKTTALRALARRIGTPPDPRRVCVVDERCEFCPSDYAAAHVDLLQGYRRAAGLELAVRTLSAEVLMVDEIGSEREAEAMLGVLQSGIPLIATAHAADVGEVLSKRGLRPLLAAGLFDVLVGLSREGGRFRAAVHRLTEAKDLREVTGA